MQVAYPVGEQARRPCHPSIAQPKPFVNRVTTPFLALIALFDCEIHNNPSSGQTGKPLYGSINCRRMAYLTTSVREWRSSLDIRLVR
jgi:hypothetical protein